jgi:predicted SprT family Zn-dependent metalloprotease
MSKKEAPISSLQQFLPPNTYDAVIEYLHQYKVHLTVARERKSILGDYRHRTHIKNHRISVNGTLNKYAFLITLLHELAHLLTFEQYGNKVQSHGREWKTIFGQLLAQFIQHNVFPDDIKKALISSISNPAASSCADEVLLRTLRRYDAKNGTTATKLVEEVPHEALFKTHDGKVFKKGEKVRKRFKCMEVQTGRLYLFSPVYEVELIA